jgi:hypothetical protein
MHNRFYCCERATHIAMMGLWLVFCTMNLLALLQDCQLLMVLAFTAFVTASFGFALVITINGSLTPSSSTVFFTCFPA